MDASHAVDGSAELVFLDLAIQGPLADAEQVGRLFAIATGELGQLLPVLLEALGGEMEKA